IAERSLIDYARRRKSEMAALRYRFDVERSRVHSVPAEAVAAREGHEVLLQALDKLNHLDKTILTWKAFEDLSSFDIAKRLGMPASTVRRRLKQASARLRMLLRSSRENPGG